MDFMICAHGNPEEEEFIPYIKDYVDGVELQNYGLTGSKSIAAWNEKLTQHKSIAKKLPGRLAVHGPFFGMDYTCQDHLVREAVRKRLDMTYQMVCVSLNPILWSCMQDGRKSLEGSVLEITGLRKMRNSGGMRS